MRIALILLCAMLCAFPALAQEASISIDDCQHIVGHVPGADVAYQPGVDVNGDLVTPADVPPAPGMREIRPPDHIVIDFGIDLEGKYGVPSGGFYTATTDMFTIDYDLAMGALTVNGKPLGSAETKAVRDACAKVLQGGDAGQ